MPAKTPQETAHERLNMLAAEAVEKNPEPANATTYIARCLTKKDRELLVDECIAQAMQLHVWRANARANYHAKHIDRNVDRDAAANRLLARAASDFLDTISFGGIRLGDMTGVDLDVQIKLSKAHAAGHQRNVMLLSTLRKTVGDTERVRDKWTDDQAIKVNDNLSKINAA